MTTRALPTSPRRQRKPAIEAPISTGVARRPDVVGRALLIVAFVMGAVLGWEAIWSPDVGFHLSFGRWIVEHHAIPRTDALTYTVPDNPYVDLCWLFQLGLYAVNAVAGTGGIIAGQIALTLLFWALMLLRVRRREGIAPFPFYSSCVLLLLLTVSTPTENRPQLLSWIYGSLLLLVLESPPAMRRRWLPALPAILLLWVNSHSLFSLGIVILAVFVADELRKRRDRDARLMPWAMAAVAACVVNPYGLKGMTFPLTQFAELQAGSPVKSPEYGILELLSPFNPRCFTSEGHIVWLGPVMLQFAFVALLLVALVAGRRQIRLREVALLLVFGYLYATAVKNFQYLVMVSFPLAASGLEVAGHAAARSVAKLLRTPQPAPAARRIHRGVLSVVVLGLFVAASTGALANAAGTPHRRGPGVDPRYLPVGACRFLREHGVQGRVLNVLRTGGYIYWVTRQPVFVHGVAEILGPRFYLDSIAALQPRGLEEVLRRWQPQVAVVSVSDAPAWLYVLGHRRDWRIVYRDIEDTVLLHESLRPDLPALPPPRAGVDYPEYDDASADRIVRAAVTKPPPNLLQRLRGPAAYPRDALREVGYFLRTDAPEAAIGTALKGLERTPFAVPPLVLVLGHAYNARGDYPRADACFDAFLRADPDSPLGRDVRRVRAARRRFG